MSAVFCVLARCVFIVTLLAAPWALGGADRMAQRWLFAGTFLAGVLAWLGCVGNRSARLSGPATALLLLVAAMLALGALQLFPQESLPDLAHGELTGRLNVLVGDDSPSAARSLYPAATRLQMARLALGLCAFVTGAWLFSEKSARQGLWAVLALNGVATVGFGLVQRASWNGKLYWRFPLELGGQPFAAFVNRNNAAEYLSMCLAGALGLWASRRVRLDLARSEIGSAERVGGGSIWDRLPAMTWSVLILLLFGGVLATLSRGGALSAVAAIVLIGAWAAAGGRTRTVLLPLLGIVVAAVVWISVSQQGAALRARLGSLTHSAQSDGRIQHWTDMLGALRDFPQLGTGWGTYRYANRPYESHASESWFESADNQYLEIIVEGGLGAGAILVLLWLLGTGVAVYWRRLGETGEAIASRYLLFAIGLQSMTDCWWNTAANVLTFAALVGSLSAPRRHASDPRLNPLEKWQALLETRRGFVTAALLGLCVLATAGCGLYEAHLAAESSQFRQRLPDEDERLALTSLEIDGWLAAGERILQRRPDDAELHAALARLAYYGYRLQAAAALDAAAPSRWSEAVRWERTSPQALFGTLARFREIGDAAALARFRETPPAAAHLPGMAEHARAARRSCPVLPFVGLYEAIGELLEDGEPSLPLRREAALSPARLKLLHSLALSAGMIADDELFAVSLARSIELDPHQTPTVVDAARQRFTEPEIVERLLPAVPGPLLDFAETARSPVGRSLAIEKARQASEHPALPDGDRQFARGRLALLDGNAVAAAEPLAAAVAAAPLDPQRRLYQARALHATGRTVEARDEVEFALRRSPDRRLREQLEELARQLDERNP